MSKEQREIHRSDEIQENGDGESIHQPAKVSTSDPDSTYLTKGNRAAELQFGDRGMLAGGKNIRIAFGGYGMFVALKHGKLILDP
jgi:hypothetical protein